MIEVILNTSSKELALEYNKLLTKYAPTFKLFHVQVIHSKLSPNIFNTNSTNNSVWSKDALRRICIVSPGNSFGFLNGGFDKGIMNLMNSCNSTQDFQTFFQSELRKKNKTSYSPVLTPTLVDLTNYNYMCKLPDESAPNGSVQLQYTHILHLPTMVSPEHPLFLKKPENAVHDNQKQISFVFDCCFRSFLKLQDIFSKIDCIAIPGFGAGYGGVEPSNCALGILLGIKLFELDHLRLEDELTLQHYLLQLHGYKNVNVFQENTKVSTEKLDFGKILKL
ncbi:hypothetical protein ACO0QE_002084 [Hanseniaspora vineae]